MPGHFRADTDYFRVIGDRVVVLVHVVLVDLTPRGVRLGEFRIKPDGRRVIRDGLAVIVFVVIILFAQVEEFFHAGPVAKPGDVLQATGHQRVAPPEG